MKSFWIGVLAVAMCMVAGQAEAQQAASATARRDSIGRRVSISKGMPREKGAFERRKKALLEAMERSPALAAAAARKEAEAKREE